MSAPELNPPAIVAAGLPIKNDENTMFFRRDDTGYNRLSMPTAIGILAAQAMPASPDMTSITTPVGENVVRPTMRENEARLSSRSVLRERTEQTSAR